MCFSVILRLKIIEYFAAIHSLYGSELWYYRRVCYRKPNEWDCHVQNEVSIRAVAGTLCNVVLVCEKLKLQGTLQVGKGTKFRSYSVQL